MNKNSIQLNIKPLSVNKVFQGRRFKTSDYKFYEQEIFYLLHNKELEIYDKIELNIKIGFSSKLADIDNPVKPFIDILQKKYKFNDKNIYKLIIEKEIVKKGDEYIKFNIKNYEKKQI